jgi:hydroxymethylpyrimidine pyrophosphatase-like HAD family hydrolase
MHFVALASDYDGMLADDGKITDATWAAVQRLRASGRKLMLVTGRSVADVARALSRFEAFDRIIAENGAVVYCPKEHTTALLSAGLPGSFAKQLQLRKVGPLWIGEIILAPRIENAQEILKAVRDLNLDVAIVTNNRAIMVLPAGVSKATGLAVALDELGILAKKLVSIGDGENDTALFEFTGCGVSVAIAPMIVKKAADLVTKAVAGEGSRERVDSVVTTDLAEIRSCVESWRARVRWQRTTYRKAPYTRFRQTIPILSAVSFGQPL